MGFRRAMQGLIMPRSRRRRAMAAPDLFQRELIDIDSYDACSDSSIASPDLIQRWLANCDTNHSQHCSLSDSDRTIFGIKPQYLIDVRRMCLVVAENHMNYAALSYVWGTAVSFKNLRENLNSLLTPGSLEKLQTSHKTRLSRLPKTIADAIALVRSINVHYLWVDALCIVQDDEDGKKQHIQSMGSIYANAYFTIVAANGNASDGLIGITRKANPPAASLYGERHDFLGQYRDMMKRSAWTNRGWTFQEQIFSPRLLIYGEFGVSWECHCYVGTIGINPRTEKCHKNRATITRGFDFGLEPSLRDMSRHIRSYNVRELTYPEDVLDAFAGITTVLSNFYPGGFLAGLPVCLFDESLLWVNQAPLTKRCARRPVAPRRIAPSWSWAAWQGLLQENTNTDIRPIVQWAYQQSKEHPIKTLPGLPRDPDSSPAKTSEQDIHTADELVAATNAGKFLCQAAPRWTDLLFCRPLRCKAPVAKCFEKGIILDLGQDLAKFVNVGILDGCITSCESLTQGVLPTECELVAISKNTTGYHVLWIEWADGIAYRKGIGYVSTAVWQAQKLERIDLMLG